jgi:hypothetical protein
MVKGKKCSFARYSAIIDTSDRVMQIKSACTMISSHFSSLYFVFFQKVNSCELYTVLIVILVLDVACLTTWQVKDPLYRTVETFNMETQTNTDEDVMYQPQLEHCTSKNMSVWLGK